MPEAVIVATARTPIGRANKGSLVDLRPDDLSATIIRAVLDKVPALDRQAVEDVIWGCGQPGGESGYNVARVAALLADLPDVPGVTVNRYCSSSLQTIRMAGHAIKAGDGPRAGTTLEKLAQLKPVFRPDGEVTAGNACPLNDGAAAVIVMSDTRARELGLQPLARIVASGVSGLNPEIMGLGPIEACRQA